MRQGPDNININGFNDSLGLDAFGRLRTSGTAQRLDVEFLYNKQEEYMDEVTNNGTVTFNANTRDLTLSLGDANNGSYAKMASHPVPYTPGNSQLIDITGVLDLAGIGGGTAEVFLRSKISGSVVETVTTQTDWTNPMSDVDWTKSHIFLMDFQSLKVGRIRFGLVQNGVPVPVTEITNDNLRDSGYWQIPNLPVYWHLYTTGGTTYMEVGYGNADNGIGFRYKFTANASATMKAICSSVKSEGGLDLRNMPGLPRSINSGVTTKTVSTTRIPILSIRPRSTFATYDNLVLSIPKTFAIQTTEAIRIDVIHDGTLTNASWVNVDTNESAVEYDVSATAISNGHVLYSTYIYATATGPASAQVISSAESLLGKTVLWNRQGTETGIFTIAAVRTGGTDAAVLSSINWEELR